MGSIVTATAAQFQEASGWTLAGFTQDLVEKGRFFDIIIWVERRGYQEARSVYNFRIWAIRSFISFFSINKSG